MSKYAGTQTEKNLEAAFAGEGGLQILLGLGARVFAHNAYPPCFWRSGPPFGIL